ncbi:MAG TPA: hypothetical protein VJM69_05665, partial [Dehalococcoidia bacterium]|nr:hypothetical protein [Dehalococcoidia bacterium]
MSWGFPAGYHPALIADRQAAIQPLLDLHSGLGIAEAAGPGQELKSVASEAHRVVPSLRSRAGPG